MYNVELMELKAKLKKLENEYLNNFDSYTEQENKYFLTDIEILQCKIKKLERLIKSTKKIIIK